MPRERLRTSVPAPRGDFARRIDAYLALIARWNPAAGLVSVRDLGRLQGRHVMESLLLAEFLDDQSFVDIGSGAGFPGLLAAAARGLPVILVERDHRKAAFLREAARVLEVRAIVHASRVEELRIPSAVCLTARAVAPLPRLIAMVAPIARPAARGIFLVSAEQESRLTSPQVPGESCGDSHKENKIKVLKSIPYKFDDNPQGAVVMISGFGRAAHPGSPTEAARSG